MEGGGAVENFQIKQLSGWAGISRPRALKGGVMENFQIRRFIKTRRPGRREAGRQPGREAGRQANQRAFKPPGAGKKTAPVRRRILPWIFYGGFSKNAEIEASAVSPLKGREGGSPRPLRYPASAAAAGQSAAAGRKSQKGFLMVMLLPLLALMMTGILGFSLLSLGIKNISSAQKFCILTGLAGQRELKAVLERLLALNKTVVSLHRKRQALQKAYEAAVSTGLLHAAAALRKKIMFLKIKQKALALKQRRLLKSGALAKKKTLQKLRQRLRGIKAKNIREDTFYKKALAVLRKRLGPHAETYRPMPDFPNRQKTVFSWDMGLFFPILRVEDFGQSEIQRPARYSCAATLEKGAGQIWRTRLSQPEPAGFFRKAK